MGNDPTESVKVLFFGYLQARIGRPGLEVQADSLADLKAELSEQYPTVMDPSFSVAVNGAVQTGDIALQPGDEVAFLPPFAGG